MIEAETQGKIPALCATGSPFLVDLNACGGCIDSFNGSTANVTQFIPSFARFLDYCNSLNVSNATATNSLLLAINSEAGLISSLQAQLSSLEVGGTAQSTTALATTTASNVATPTPGAIGQYFNSLCAGNLG